MKNTEFSILKGLGIIAVVIGHSSWRLDNIFDPYSFHMALFIFISGYFYKISYEDNCILFIKNKIKSLVIPYFLYNLFYAVLTNMIYRLSGLILGSEFTIKNFFIRPFVDGHQYDLFLPAWFVLQLFIIQVVFLFLYKFIKKITSKKYIHFLIFLSLALLGTTVGTLFSLENIYLIACRTFFGLFFFYFGLLYRNSIEKITIFNTKILFFIIILQVILSQNFNVNYELVWGKFHGGIALPIVTSINGIYLYLFITKSLYRLIPKNDFLVKIGENSFHIMANHLLIFFILNIFFIKFNNLEFSLLQNIWFKYNIEKTWWLYISLGVLVPTIITFIFNNIKNYIQVKNTLYFKLIKPKSPSLIFRLVVKPLKNL